MTDEGVGLASTIRCLFCACARLADSETCLMAGGAAQPPDRSCPWGPRGAVPPVLGRVTWGRAPGTNSSTVDLKEREGLETKLEGFHKTKTLEPSGFLSGLDSVCPHPQLVFARLPLTEAPSDGV